MANTTFSGPVISKNGFIGFGPGMSKAINSTGLGAAGLPLTVADHAGRLLISQDADGIYALPSINTNVIVFYWLHYRHWSCLYFKQSA